MKRLEVELRPSADADIDRLEAWLAMDGASFETIDRYIERLIARCRSLGDAPGAGRCRDDLMPGLRTSLFENRVLIAYRINGDVLEILNLFSHGRDYEAFYSDDDERG